MTYAEKARELDSRLKFRPIADNVVILMHERGRVSQGGIHIPDTANELTIRATVVRCGPGTPDFPVTVKPGDEVLLGESMDRKARRPGHECGEPIVGSSDVNAAALGLLPGEELRVVRESEIVAVLEVEP